MDIETNNPLENKGFLKCLLRRVRDLNSGADYRRLRISNPLHYRSANSPNAEDEGLEPTRAINPAVFKTAALPIRLILQITR